MNALVVYFSKFGHTRSIAQAIATTLETAGATRLFSIEELSASDLASVDLLVVGTPTHRMNLPEQVRATLDKLPRRVLRGTSIAAFDTSYKMSPFLARFTAAKKLPRKLRRLGGRRIVLPETFYVEGREGPLYVGEIERAQEWAGSILQQLGSQTR